MIAKQNARVILNSILSITVTFEINFLFFIKVEVILSIKFTITVLNPLDFRRFFQLQNIF